LDAICSLKVGISKNWGHHPRLTEEEVGQVWPMVEQTATIFGYTI